jgi:hypothetical protein
VHGRQDRGSISLVCVDWATGKRTWEQKRFGAAHLLSLNDSLLAWTESGAVVQFSANATKYKELQRVNLIDGTTWQAPALSSGTLFVRNENKLYAISLK